MPAGGEGGDRQRHAAAGAFCHERTGARCQACGAFGEFRAIIFDRRSAVSFYALVFDSRAIGDFSASPPLATSTPDAAANTASPAKTAKKPPSSAKAVAQPAPAASSNETTPAGAATKKATAAVADAPAEPAASTAAPPPSPALPAPSLGFIPPRKKLMIARSCHDDFRAYCPGVDVGGGRAITCLSENVAKLTPDCREALAKLAR